MGIIAMRNIYSKLLALGVILFLGTLIYSNTFHSEFQLDDNPSIIDNVSIRNIKDLEHIFNFWPSRFLTYLSISINYHFHQLNVVGYHVLNLIIHLGSALLVYWFVQLTFLTPAMRTNRIASYSHWIGFLSGLIFVSHPIQTEAVTYIVQRATSLATFFYLASICLYIKARLQEDKKVRSSQKKLYYSGALITIVMSMLSKEMSITLPLMILLYETFFFKNTKGINWKLLTPILLTILIIPLIMLSSKYIDFQNLKRAGEQPQEIDSIHYLLTQFRVILTYLRLLLLPINQNLDYYYPSSKSIFEFATFSSLLILISVFYGAIRLFKNYRILSFSLFFFFLTLLPESSILPIKDVIFEHRLYLPMVGFCLFLVSALFYIFSKRSMMVIAVILTLFIGINSVLTYERNKVWQNMFNLWSDTANKSPQKERPLSNLGLCYDMKGNYSEALKYYKRAKEIKPEFPEAYYNSGVVYNKLKDSVRALEEYNKAIEFNPYYSAAYNNRGSIYDIQGNLPQAILDYTKAINFDPNRAVYYKNRANTYKKLKKLNEAIDDYIRTIKLDPKDVLVFNNLGIIYHELGKFEFALDNYSKAITLSPDSAQLYLNRGNSYFTLGKLNEALIDYTKAIELNPNYADAYSNQAVTYLQLKNFDKAWDVVKKLEQLPGSYDLQRINAIKNELMQKK